MSSGPRLRRSQEDRSAETRALLIGAAIELLRSVGYSGTTTALIAQRAGLTTGALHHHFPTKDELIFAVLNDVGRRVGEHLSSEEHLPAGGPLDVGGLIRHLWQVYGAPDYWAVWEIILGTRADPKLHGRMVSHRIESLRSVLHPWIERHVVSEEARPETVALFEFMLIAIRGLCLERFLDKDAAYFARNLDLLAALVERRLTDLGLHDAVQ